MPDDPDTIGLDIHVTRAEDGARRVRVTAGDDRGASHAFAFDLDARRREALRWYLEDYLVLPAEPAPAVARRIEARLPEIGDALFAGVFPDGLPTHAADHLGGLRVAVRTDDPTAAHMPWELMRDPASGRYLAVEAAGFVHAVGDDEPLHVATSAERPLRILFVISRPGGTDDVPFRSIARRLTAHVAGSSAIDFQVLRPPTLDRLRAVVEEARDAGTPFDPRTQRTPPPPTTR